MDRHDGPVRHESERVLDRMETRKAAADQALRHRESRLGAEVAPALQVRRRKDRNDLKIINSLPETHDGALEDGNSLQKKELLRPVRPHPGTASAGRNDQIFFSFHPRSF